MCYGRPHAASPHAILSPLRIAATEGGLQTALVGAAILIDFYYNSGYIR